MDDVENLHRVYSQLDQLAIDYLQKLEEYTQEWHMAGDLMQKGFLDLAHAKYTMGSSRISRYSYDGRMKAQLQIAVDGDTKQAPFTTTFVSSSQDKPKNDADSEKCPQLSLRRRLVGTPDNDGDSDSSEWSRHDEPDDVADEDAYEMNEKKSTKTKTKNQSGDPLQWFGFLVSPSLRTSQDHFKQATARLICQANLVHELNCLEEEYRALEQTKQELISQQQPSINET